MSLSKLTALEIRRYGLLCLISVFFPCFGDAATAAGQTGQTYVKQVSFFFPLKAKPLRHGVPAGQGQRPEAGRDNRGTETLSQLQPITRVFNEVIPARRFLNTRLVTE